MQLSKYGMLNKRERLTAYCLLLLAFLLGLSLPSPFFQRKIRTLMSLSDIELSDTINMQIANGVYNGSIIKGTTKRHGYGVFTHNNGAIYEGEWKNDALPYGNLTTKVSIYNGHFDQDLNINGFGIVRYSDQYIDGKRKQGQNDTEITSVYIGNWNKNVKEGLGRAVKVNGNMEFGYFREGVLPKVAGANYRIGGSVYGIDLSHFQADIDWNNLALYCDKNGNVFNKPAKDKTYMQPVFFAYIKSTEGATIKDEMFSIRMIEAERHGIVKGTYHFLRLGSPIEAQLKNFFETATYTKGDLPPALDIEMENEILQYGVAQMQSMALKWLEDVEKKMGVRPIIYTRENLRNKYLNDSRFKKYQFWIARYSDNGPDNFDWQIWQKTEKGQMGGHKGNVDINLFRGNYDALKKYIDQ